MPLPAIAGPLSFLNPLGDITSAFGSAPSSATQTGDSKSGAAVDFYFSSPFAVGSGAKATSDQSGAGSTGDDIMKTGLYVLGGLIAVALAVKYFKK